MRETPRSRAPARLARPRLGAPELAVLAVAAGALHAAPVRASITGVCPDGSVFVAQSEAGVPCPEAKRVDPHEVPPVRPEYLPRPYTWEVYGESDDPENPYNLIDRAERVRELQGRGDGEVGGLSEPERDAGEGEPRPAVGAGPPGLASSAAAPRLSPEALHLSDDEIRDLFLLVEAAQRQAPARFVKRTARGEERVRVSLAHSAAFQARFADTAAGTRGLPGRQVVLWSAVAEAGEEPFHGNLTFAQQHYAFHPDASDPRQLGVLYGRLGTLAPGEAALGYVVLPDSIDLGAPLDVYWNDRRTSATLRP